LFRHTLNVAAAFLFVLLLPAMIHAQVVAAGGGGFALTRYSTADQITKFKAGTVTAQLGYKVGRVSILALGQDSWIARTQFAAPQALTNTVPPSLRGDTLFANFYEKGRDWGLGPAVAVALSPKVTLMPYMMWGKSFWKPRIRDNPDSGNGAEFIIESKIPDTETPQVFRQDEDVPRCPAKTYCHDPLDPRHWTYSVGASVEYELGCKGWLCARVRVRPEYYQSPYGRTYQNNFRVFGEFVVGRFK
jgi:hypothetical protein